MVAMNTWILSMKIILISSGVLSLAIAMKFSVPIAVNRVPAIWSVILSWLKPPYLYIVINGIIITIAAVSHFHQTHSDAPVFQYEKQLISIKAPQPSDFSSLSAEQMISTFMEETTSEDVVYESSNRVVDLKPVTVNGSKVEIPTEEQIAAEIETDVFVDSSFAYNISLHGIISPESELHQEKSVFPVREKPLVSSRFGHRKPIGTNHEVNSGRVLRVTRPKKQDTLENTWKAITEGRHVPLTRHLKKPDTWEQHGRHIVPVVDHVTKSQTFNNRTRHNSSLRIRKEPSLGQDELNRRVEAFIKEFNDDMRMQRQESLNQYMEIINRGV